MEANCIEGSKIIIRVKCTYDCIFSNEERENGRYASVIQTRR